MATRNFAIFIIAKKTEQLSHRNLCILQYWIVLITIILFHAQGHGQQLPYTFTHLNSNDGLKKNVVNCMAQDSIGHIWFGTYDGLQRYDGYFFETFQFHVDDTLGLMSNQIQALLYSTKGQLWVGTENGGLNLFNDDTETFTHFLNDPADSTSLSSNHVNHIFEDLQGNLWVSTRKGLNKFDESTQSFQRFFSKGELEFNFISYTHSVTPGVLWVATLGSGLIKFNTNNHSFEQLTTEVPQTINNNKVWVVYDDSVSHKLWIGTENGINVWNFNSTAFEYYHYAEEELRNSGYNVVRRIMPGLGHDIWLGSDGGGLYQLNHEQGLFREFMVNTQLENSLSSNSISTLFKDKDDNLWIGCTNNGVDRIDLRQLPVYHVDINKGNDNSSKESNIVNNIHKDVDGEFWFATEDGLVRTRDMQNYQYYHQGLSESNNICNSTVLTVYESNKNELYFGTYLGGISIFNKKSDSFRHLKYDPGSRRSLSSNFVRSILQDENGLFWIGSIHGGVDIYDPFKDTVINYAHLLESDFVTKIIKDSEDNMYVATYGSGVYKFSNTTVLLDHFHSGSNCQTPIIHNLATSILFDNDSNLWVGTANGLSKICANTGESIHFGKQEGLPDNAINSLVDDGNGRLWIGTNNGIAKLNKESYAIRRFGQKDGFLSNEYRYNSVYKDERGWLYFGGVNGVCYFNPAEINSQVRSSEIKFTNLFLFNKEARVGEIINKQVVLDKPLNHTKTLILNHRNRMFSIRFSTFLFQDLHKIQHSYMFEGKDENWVDIGKSNVISFHNLPYGSYKLIVKATNTSSRVDIATKTLNVIIKPPFYATLFAKIFVLALVLGLVVMYYFVRLKRVKQQKALLEIMVKEKTVDLHETNTLLEEQQAELEMQAEELVVQKNFVQDQNDKILEQNRELELHRNDLEKIVNERTKDLLKAKVEAEKADALKTAFLANMSHEIRTPMNAILGFIDLVDQPDFTLKEKQKFKNLIHSSGDSLLSLINDIIDIAKIESGEIDIHYESFDLNAMFNNLYTIYTKKLEEINSKAVLVASCQEDFTIFSDKQRIKQVMINLLDNALKFTEKGEVEFGYSIGKNVVSFFVKDSGVGMERNEQDLIFQRFRKLENDQDKLYRGTGLGLAISKNLVELMGGKIRVKSEKGVGSTFSFTIPK